MQPFAQGGDASGAATALHAVVPSMSRCNTGDYRKVLAKNPGSEIGRKGLERLNAAN
jgi:hypothetical protein